MREWIYGRNPVLEILRAGRRHAFALRVAEGVAVKGPLADLLRLCEARRIPIQRVSRKQLDVIGANHQGVALEASGYPYREMEDMLALATRRNELPFLLILDALQDPQNLGALLRTAEAVGVHGVLLPLRRTATVTPAVVNASSGASEHLLIGQRNIASCIEALKREDVWVVGLEAGAQAQAIDQVRLDGPLALVVGSEGQGMRRLVRASCDLLVRLPARGRVESLNAAAAGSIALYLAWQARGFA